MRDTKGRFIKGNTEGDIALQKWRKSGGLVWNKGIHQWVNKNHPMLGKSNVSGEKHHNWQGDNVKYRALHTWVEGQLGKANHCENNSKHISTRYHWANISGDYKRDINDWRQLCPSCNFNDGVKIPEKYYRKGAFL